MPNDRTHWWSTVVEPYLRAPGHDDWLDDSFVITELHVHPDYQNRGIGRALITDDHRRRRPSPARSSPPSTPTARPARLYHSLGYQDLARQVLFPSAPKPVRGDGRPAAAAPPLDRPVPGRDRSVPDRHSPPG